MKRQRGGFTLIELLIVMGIILVLVSLAVIGYNVIEKSVAGRSTQQTLQNLRAMLSELDAQAGSAALPPCFDPLNNKTVSVLNDPTPSATRLVIGDVNSGSSNNFRYNNAQDVMQATEVAMGALARVPKNKQALSQLPPKQILRDASGNPLPTTIMDSQGNPLSVGPVLLDGWGNPIIYVPAGGIWVNVMAGNAPQLVHIQSPDGRPFFASAGQDGNFGAEASTPAQPPAFGDDNIYSYQN